MHMCVRGSEGVRGGHTHTRAVSTKSKQPEAILGCRLIISAVTLKMHKCCLNAIQEMQLAVIREKAKACQG